jgi:hypothetical protein
VLKNSNIIFFKQKILRPCDFLEYRIYAEY